MPPKKPKPIYTAANCRAAYQLNWSLTVFWRSTVPDSAWLEPLKKAVEKDRVRILSHQLKSFSISQFLISTTPETSPSSIIRTIKGRLQYIIRDTVPKAFRRNYSIYSLGSAKRNVIEGYVTSQLDHHQMADRRVQEKLALFQIHRPHIELSRIMRSNYGEYICNLHLVLVNDERWMEIRDEVLKNIRDALLKISEKKGHRLSRGGVFPDHIHLTLGCNINESPGEVALGYLNNLAYAQGMKPVYRSGYYVGTFGEYDLGAVR